MSLPPTLLGHPFNLFPPSLSLPAQSNYVLASLFTIVVLIIGVYIVLNLFLAVLLGNLNQIEGDGTEDDENKGGPSPITEEAAAVARSVPSRWAATSGRQPRSPFTEPE